MIIRASRVSWAVVVACFECIKVCCGDAARCLLVAGHRFVGIVGSLSGLLVRRFLLPGGLRMASRTSCMSCWTWESCIVISSIAVEEVAVSGEWGAVVAMVSLILFVRVSTAALRAALSSLDTS
jgi:hypothetical protein